MSLYKTVLSFGVSVVIFALTTLSTIVHASESKDPQVVIPHVTQKVLKSIEIERDAIKQDPQLIIDLLSQHLLPHVDYKYAAYKVLGSSFKKVLREKLPTYMIAFKDYLVATYATAFMKFENYTVQFEYRPTQKGQKVSTIRAVVKSEGKPDINFALKARYNKKTNEWKVYDMIAEGISLISAKQSEVSSILRQQGIDAVVELLKKNTKVIIE